MAGRMGGETVTIKNLKVVSIDEEKNEMAILGAIPGVPRGLVIIKKIASGKLSDLAQEVEQVQVEKEVKEEEEEKKEE
jgi:ribosomal protein L3